jgi:signal recognition particle subunit SRP68
MIICMYNNILQNTSDLSDLVSSGRDQKPEEVSFAEECSCKSLAFRAERLSCWSNFFPDLRDIPS